MNFFFLRYIYKHTFFFTALKKNMSADAHVHSEYAYQYANSPDVVYEWISTQKIDEEVFFLDPVRSFYLNKSGDGYKWFFFCYIDRTYYSVTTKRRRGNKPPQQVNKQAGKVTNCTQFHGHLERKTTGWHNIYYSKLKDRTADDVYRRPPPKGYTRYEPKATQRAVECDMALLNAHASVYVFFKANPTQNDKNLAPPRFMTCVELADSALIGNDCGAFWVGPDGKKCEDGQDDMCLPVCTQSIERGNSSCIKLQQMNRLSAKLQYRTPPTTSIDNTTSNTQPAPPGRPPAIRNPFAKKDGPPAIPNPFNP